ncbi:NAD(P)H-dependent oxidoreductase [Microbulbifer sp. 2205BS26-8]|nr:NAD(P)H-dependent oxidoreductase [Microbulbifer sp. 2205BS26-8]MDP5208751.1 NAD(P)H-dependent oxidoreductase [Microbulbifer sp. 2205BS26-8]
MSSITVLALCGSLGQESFNKKLMQQAIQLAPKELEFSLGNLSKIPLYNEDIKNAIAWLSCY